MKSKVKSVKAAIKPTEQPRLKLIEQYGIHSHDDAGGVYMDQFGNVYCSRNRSQPKPCSLSEALEFMALRHSDGPEGYKDAHPSDTEEFFKLLAVRLRDCPAAKPVRPVSELDEVAAFADSQLLTDGSGYFVTNGEKSARPVGLKEALRWYYKRYLENDAEGDLDDQLWTDFLETVANKLPEVL